ncbi:apolipoprotein L3-like [Acomys russatus]|uniref:apolipoprotein L3-like n=1 Tax=Acomys russatus TaxID=60746 RepID=UPI0021E2819D|nr:apolipoprotein L3-like [Acomys russatus]
MALDTFLFYMDLPECYEGRVTRDEETAALHDALKEHVAQRPTEDERSERELQRRRILEEFPQLKSKLEENIRKLRDLADHLDQVHRGCTISNVVSSVASIASGVVGLCAGPATGGASLLLSEAALGTGALSSVSGVASSATEEIIRWIDEAEAKRLVGASRSILEKMLVLFKFPIETINTGMDLVLAWKTLGQQIRSYRMARENPLYRVEARTIGRISDVGSMEIESALSDSVLPMTRGARIRAIAFPSIMFVIDGYHLIKDSMDLYKGATTESGAALRDLADKLEKKVQGFEPTYKALQPYLP